MGKIRSAWEIALEKTENMEIDQEKIRQNAKIDKIKHIVGSYLISDEEDFDKLKTQLAEFTLKENREALKTTILNSLVLPQEENTGDDRKKRIALLLGYLYPERSEIVDLYNQIVTHVNQYPKHKEELIKQLKAQLEPMLKQKEEALKDKYGESVHLTFESDKECMETLKSYLDRLSNQYTETLDEAKAQLKEMLDK